MAVNKFLFQDGTDIKKYGTTVSEEDITPIMTSYTSPTPYNVTQDANSEWGSPYDGWQAFNAEEHPTMFKTVTGWLTLDFGVSKIVSKYSLTSPTSYYRVDNRDPKNWQLLGSNDNSTWSTIDTQTNQTGWVASEKREYIIQTPASYRYYKLNVTANNGDTNYTNIGLIQYIGNLESYGWQTLGTAPATKAMFDTDGMTDLSIITNEAIQGLVSDTPEVLCWTDETSASRTANLTAIPLPQLLLPVGDITVGGLESVRVDTKMIGEYSSIIPTMTSNNAPTPYTLSGNAQNNGSYLYQAFDQIGSTYWESNMQTGFITINLSSNNKKCVKKYTLKSPSINTNYMAKNWTFEGSNDNTTWNILDTQTSQTGWSASEQREFIVNNDLSYQYYRVNVSANNGGAFLRISEIKMFEAISGNTDIKLLVSGDSGVSWKGLNNISTDPANLPEVKANGFTPEEFNSLTKEELASLFPAGTARFALYLEQEKSTDIVQVNSLSINERQYTMTPSVDSLSVIYELLESEKPALYVSRDDGVSWKQVQADQLTKLDDLPEGSKLRVKAVLQNGQELHGLSYSWI